MNKTINYTIGWSSAHTITKVLFDFTIIIILSRFIEPIEFGRVGILLGIIGFATIFVDNGLGKAIIQFKEISHSDLNRIFTFSLILSSCFFIILQFLTSSILKFLEFEELSVHFRVLCLILITYSLRIVQSSLLVRNLQFKKRFYIYFFANIFSMILISGTLFYYNGKIGIWILIFKEISNSFFHCLFLWILGIWKNPGFKFNFYKLKNHFSFSSYLFFSAILQNIFLNIQNIYIGKTLSFSELAYLNRAKRISQISPNLISSILKSIILPIFSKIQDDKKQFHSHIFKNIELLVLISTPIALLLYINAEDLIVLLFGSKWLSTTDYVYIFIPIALSIPFLDNIKSILNSIGLTKKTFQLNITLVIMQIFNLFILYFLGIKPMLWGTLISNILVLNYGLWILKEKNNYSITQNFQTIFINILYFILYFFTDNYINIQTERLIINILLNSIIYIIIYICLQFFLNKNNLKILFIRKN